VTVNQIQIYVDIGISRGDELRVVPYNGVDLINLTQRVVPLPRYSGIIEGNLGGAKGLDD